MINDGKSGLYFDDAKKEQLIQDLQTRLLISGVDNREALSAKNEVVQSVINLLNGMLTFDPHQRIFPVDVEASLIKISKMTHLDAMKVQINVFVSECANTMGGSETQDEYEDDHNTDETQLNIVGVDSWDDV